MTGSSNTLLEFGNLINFLAPDEYHVQRDGEMIGASAVADVVIENGQATRQQQRLSHSGLGEFLTRRSVALLCTKLVRTITAASNGLRVFQTEALLACRAPLTDLICPLPDAKVTHWAVISNQLPECRHAGTALPLSRQNASSSIPELSVVLGPSVVECRF